MCNTIPIMWNQLVGRIMQVCGLIILYPVDAVVEVSRLTSNYLGSVTVLTGINMFSIIPVSLSLKIVMNFKLNLPHNSLVIMWS